MSIFPCTMTTSSYQAQALHLPCIHLLPLFSSVGTFPSIDKHIGLSIVLRKKKKTTKTLLETGCALYLLPLSPLSFTGDLKPATFTEFTPHVLLTVLPNTIWLFPPPLHWHSPFKSLHFVISLEVGLCKLGFKNLERRHDTAILLQFSLLFFPALAN